MIAKTTKSALSEAALTARTVAKYHAARAGKGKQGATLPAASQSERNVHWLASLAHERAAAIIERAASVVESGDAATVERIGRP